jgi:hypothetical protein
LSGGLVSFFTKDAYNAPYTKDLLEAIKSGGKGGGGSNNFFGGLGSNLKNLGKTLLPFVPKIVGGAGLGMGVWDAFQAQKKAGDWFDRKPGEKVPVGERIAAGVGGFLGGTGKGLGEKGATAGEITKNALWNAAKGAAIGFMVGGPVGAVVGGVIGGGAGLIGGKRIAKGAEAMAETAQDAGLMTVGGPMGAQWAKENKERRDAQKIEFRKKEAIRMGELPESPEIGMAAQVSRSVSAKAVADRNLAAAGPALNAKAISDAISSSMKSNLSSTPASLSSSRPAEMMSRNKDLVLENLITGELDETW